ncbi:MAG TPA: SIS domain-containing protein [Xanthobacteraceae bacterium]|nr:SIS domain-containing protein [Xanthobacteraceae bacterium]
MTPIAGGMAGELREAAAAVRRQTQTLVEPLSALTRRLIRQRPRVIVTCARGSSAHAATFAKHLFERHLGVPVAAAALNIASVYHRPLDLRDQMLLVISQSGRSDDLIETAAMARAAGAVTVAIVNDLTSPLTQTAEIVLPLAAGPELSVAATKSFVASLAALLQLVATWTGDAAMAAACARLPNRLEEAGEVDWSQAIEPLARATSMVAVGRGPTLAIAREAALKLKETCELHAEAFSAAEFRHGPIALVSSAYPILALAPTDESAAGLAKLAADLRRKGARVFVAEPGSAQRGRLPVLASDHPDADAICLIQSFYAFLVRLAAHRGTDVDRPQHLQKVTRTR